MQTIDDLLPPQSDHDQFVLDLINTSSKGIEQHYQQFAQELALNTNVYDVQPQLAFRLDGHDLNIQYTPFTDHDERQESIKIVRFDGQKCDVQLYIGQSVIRNKENVCYVYAVVNIQHDTRLTPNLYSQVFLHYQNAVNFAQKQAESHLQDYKKAEITTLHKSNDQPYSFLIQNDHRQLEKFTITELEVKPWITLCYLNEPSAKFTRLLVSTFMINPATT